MHFVAHVDWSFADDPMPASDRSKGLARKVLIGPDQGAVHTELALGALHPGGWLRRHVHSYEEALYVLDGELLLEHDGRVHRLVKGDFALNPLGVWHGLGNDSDGPARWMSVNTPQRLGPDAGRKDTLYQKGPADLASLSARAQRPAFGPSLRYVGHYDGTPPQAEALRLTDPARGRTPVGMNEALIVYSGISVKMLVDRGFGADLLTMFTVDYEPGGSAQQHDHPFEEAYFFLAGDVEAELDGTVYQIHPGDVVFSAVGGVHGFYNNGAEQVRWIETQAPQPPTRHAYRWLPVWEKFEEENDVE
jgi:quercetin dioxygenase-like cupin family protein